MKYLKGTTRRRLMYTKINNPLVSYSNVDWVGDSNTRRSTSIYFFIANGVVS
jgi:hypothetical protein